MLADRHYTGALVLMSGFDARVLGTARALGQSLGLKVEGVLEKPLRVAELEQLLRTGASPRASRCRPSGCCGPSPTTSWCWISSRSCRAGRTC